MRTDLLDNSGLHKRVQGFVNRCQRDGGQLRANALENLFGIRVIGHLHQLAVDHEALMGHGQVFVPAKLLKMNFEGLSHGFSVQQ